MAPRLYLILSDDRSGLVKIGRTDPAESNIEDMAVIERVRRYATGISHSATVVQAPGAAIFESWLHQFMGERRKPITIRFVFRPGSVISPKEWFELSPDLARILSDAFMSDPPQTVGEINISDLPVFLSGAMAVIRWHAKNESLETLAVMEATAEIQSLVDRINTTEYPPTQYPKSDLTNTLSVETPTASPIDGITHTTPAQSDISAAVRDLLDTPIKLAQLQAQMQTLRATETLRTYIAITTAILVSVIGVFGAPVGAAWFAVLGSLLLAFWPNILPRTAVWVVDHLQRDAVAARAKNSARIEDE